MTQLKPPQDLDAELALLASVISSERDLDDASPYLRAEDFADPKHSAVYAAIVATDEGGQRVDAVAVLQTLRATQTGFSGDAEFLARLFDSPVLADVGAQARRVNALARQRRLIATLHRLAASGYTATDPDAWIDQVEQVVFEAAERPEFKVDETFEEQLTETLTTIEERRKPDGVKEFWRTSLSDLNRMVHGFRPGMTVIAAPPGVGKTSFILQELCKLAGQEQNGETAAAVMFSIEMPRAQIVERSLAQTASIDSDSIVSGQLGDAEWQSLVTAAGALASKPIHIDDRSTLTVSEMRSATRRAFGKLKRKFPNKKLKLVMVAVDYLQLMSGNNREGRTVEIEGITNGLRQFAKDFGVCLAVLSQLTRDQRKEKRRPMPSDLRGCGSIEQDANAIWFLHNETMERAAKERDPRTTLIVAKNRGGNTGDVDAYFEGKTQTFTGYEQDPNRQEYETSWNEM